MAVLIPVTTRHACLSFTHRSTIHASLEAPLDWLGKFHVDGQRHAFRTVCGVDAFPVAHRVAARPGDVMLATWPPPVHGRDSDRCDDCARRLGLNGRQRAGSYHWQELIDSEEAA